MSNINCIIAEDEPLAQERLKGYIKKLPFLHLAGVFDNGIDGITSSLHKQFMRTEFWVALFRNKTEALIPRQKFFSILFGDNGGEEGFEKAVEWLSNLIQEK